MQTHLRLAILAGFAGICSGCMSDEYRRADGLTDSAGNSMAANSVMQMVDPWQDGVENTKLLVPAARGSSQQSAADDAGATGSQSTNAN